MFHPSAIAAPFGSLTLDGDLSTPLDLTVTGSFIWNGSALRGSNGQGSLTVLSDSTLNSNGAVADFTLINAATMIWNGGTVQFYGNTSRFINLEGATFDDQIDGAFGRHCRAARTMTV